MKQAFKTILEGIKLKIDNIIANIPKKLSELENDLPVVQSDWNQVDETASDYVKNRPFYSTAITLLSSWDGDTTGLDMVSCADWNDYRIGDAIPYEDIIGATIYFSDSTNIKIKKEDVYIESSVYWNIYFSNIGSGDIQLSSVAEDNYAIYTKAGLYHSNMSDAYITKIVKEEVKTIDSKYLPDHVHSWNNIEDKPTADDALALLAEVGMIDPVVDSNGSIYIEENNVIYTL